MVVCVQHVLSDERVVAMACKVAEKTDDDNGDDVDDKNSTNGEGDHPVLATVIVSVSKIYKVCLKVELIHSIYICIYYFKCYILW